MIWVIPTLYLNLSNPETNWEWDKIDTENIHFPKSFSWGIATYPHQVDGDYMYTN